MDLDVKIQHFNSTKQGSIPQKAIGATFFGISGKSRLFSQAVPQVVNPQFGVALFSN
jgi:hypothetical protein